MAAVTLPFDPGTATTSVSVTTNLQELVIPGGARGVSIRGTRDLWYEGANTSSVDGDAPGAGKVPLDADIWYEFDIGQGSKGESVKVAAQTGTATVYVIVEAGS